MIPKQLLALYPELENDKDLSSKLASRLADYYEFGAGSTQEEYNDHSLVLRRLFHIAKTRQLSLPHFMALLTHFAEKNPVSDDKHPKSELKTTRLAFKLLNVSDSISNLEPFVTLFEHAEIQDEILATEALIRITAKHKTAKALLALCQKSGLHVDSGSNLFISENKKNEGDVSVTEAGNKIVRLEHAIDFEWLANAANMIRRIFEDKTYRDSLYVAPAPPAPVEMSEPEDEGIELVELDLPDEAAAAADTAEAVAPQAMPEEVQADTVEPLSDDEKQAFLQAILPIFKTNFCAQLSALVDAFEKRYFNENYNGLALKKGSSKRRLLAYEQLIKCCSSDNPLSSYKELTEDKKSHFAFNVGSKHGWKDKFVANDVPERLAALDEQIKQGLAQLKYLVDPRFLKALFSHENFTTTCTGVDLELIFNISDKISFIEQIRKHYSSNSNRFNVIGWIHQGERMTFDKITGASHIARQLEGEALTDANEKRRALGIASYRPDNYYFPGALLEDMALTKELLYQMQDNDILACEQLYPRLDTEENKLNRFVLLPASLNVVVDPNNHGSPHYANYQNFKRVLRSLLNSYQQDDNDSPIIIHGTVNVNSNHFVPFFIYKNARNQIQVLTVDPSAAKKPGVKPRLTDKSTIKRAFRDIFPAGSYADAGIAQQLNERDCGFHSVQTQADALRVNNAERSLLRVVDGRLTICPEHLTANANTKRAIFYDANIDPQYMYHRDIIDTSRLIRAQWSEQLRNTGNITLYFPKDEYSFSHMTLEALFTRETFDPEQQEYNFVDNVESQQRDDAFDGKVSNLLALMLVEDGQNPAIIDAIRDNFLRSLVLPRGKELEDLQQYILKKQEHILSQRDDAAIEASNDDNVIKSEWLLSAEGTEVLNATILSHFEEHIVPALENAWIAHLKQLQVKSIERYNDILADFLPKPTVKRLMDLLTKSQTTSFFHFTEVQFCNILLPKQHRFIQATVVAAIKAQGLVWFKDFAAQRSLFDYLSADNELAPLFAYLEQYSEQLTQRKLPSIATLTDQESQSLEHRLLTASGNVVISALRNASIEETMAARANADYSAFLPDEQPNEDVMTRAMMTPVVISRLSQFVRGSVQSILADKFLNYIAEQLRANATPETIPTYAQFIRDDFSLRNYISAIISARLVLPIQLRDELLPIIAINTISIVQNIVYQHIRDNLFSTLQGKDMPADWNMSQNNKEAYILSLFGDSPDQHDYREVILDNFSAEIEQCSKHIIARANQLLAKCDLYKQILSASAFSHCTGRAAILQRLETIETPLIALSRQFDLEADAKLDGHTEALNEFSALLLRWLRVIHQEHEEDNSPEQPGFVARALIVCAQPISSDEKVPFLHVSPRDVVALNASALYPANLLTCDLDEFLQHPSVLALCLRNNTQRLVPTYQAVPGDEHPTLNDLTKSYLLSCLDFLKHRPDFAAAEDVYYKLLSIFRTLDLHLDHTQKLGFEACEQILAIVTEFMASKSNLLHAQDLDSLHQVIASLAMTKSIFVLRHQPALLAQLSRDQRGIIRRNFGSAVNSGYRTVTAIGLINEDQAEEPGKLLLSDFIRKIYEFNEPIDERTHELRGFEVNELSVTKKCLRLCASALAVNRESMLNAIDTITARHAYLPENRRFLDVEDSQLLLTTAVNIRVANWQDLKTRALQAPHRIARIPAIEFLTFSALFQIYSHNEKSRLQLFSTLMGHPRRAFKEKFETTFMMQLGNVLTHFEEKLTDPNFAYLPSDIIDRHTFHALNLMIYLREYRGSSSSKKKTSNTSRIIAALNATANFTPIKAAAPMEASTNISELTQRLNLIMNECNSCNVTFICAALIDVLHHLDRIKELFEEYMREHPLSLQFKKTENIPPYYYTTNTNPAMKLHLENYRTHGDDGDAMIKSVTFLIKDYTDIFTFATTNSLIDAFKTHHHHGVCIEGSVRPVFAWRRANPRFSINTFIDNTAPYVPFFLENAANKDNTLSNAAATLFALAWRDPRFGRGENTIRTTEGDKTSADIEKMLVEKRIYEANP